MTHSSPLEFTDAHYAALGRMLVEFQNLEQAATEAIAFCLHPKVLFPTQVFTFAVVNELSFATKIRLLRAHAVSDKLSDYFDTSDKDYEGRKAMYDEHAPLLQEGLAMALAVEQERNRLVHSNWNSRPIPGPPGTVLRSKRKITKTGFEYAFEHVSATELEEVALKAHGAWERVQGSSTALHFLRCSRAEA